MMEHPDAADDNDQELTSRVLDDQGYAGRRRRRAEDDRGAARQALVELLEGRIGQLIDPHLEGMAALGEADRRNGRYRRHLL